MKILALDPATRTGFAFRDGDGPIEYGTFSIDISGTEHAGNKLIRFRDWMIETIARLGCEKVAFEDASFGAFNQNTKAFHNQLRGVIVMVAAEHRLPFSAYKPKQIKKFATDSGAAKKDQMIRAAKLQFGIDVGDDDNQADALFILDLARQEAHGRRFDPVPTPRQKAPWKRRPKAKEKWLF